MTSAHPVSGHPHVDVPIALTAGLGALLVFVAAVALPGRSDAPAPQPRSPAFSWAGTLSRPQIGVRAVCVLLLVLAIAAGRVGVADELENLAPALVVGAGWPLLVLGSALVGPVWRWTDPFDGLARAVTRRDPSAAEPGHVWPAVVVLLPVMWFVGAYPDSLDPRAAGTALAVYTIVAVAGCVAAGRPRWLATSEPLGAVLSWMAMLPRGGLWHWQPPRGAEALLGVFAGGVLFGAVRRSELWTGSTSHRTR